MFCGATDHRRLATGGGREWVGVHTDITDQRTAEEALKDADRRKDEFLATLAHELRNPLAPVRTALQIMKLSPDAAHAVAAREMMEMHGGTVQVHSEGRGRGSTFTVRLPVATRLPAMLPVQWNNVDGAQSLATLLELMGHETHTVHDGPAALVAARQYRPAAVLLDIGLPALNGYDVGRQLRHERAAADSNAVAKPRSGAG